MTRFMMSLDDAVDLVLYAFENGNPGDLFVQKAPAATLATLASALKRIFNTNNPVRIIGTRHGEKLYETLLTREEKLVAQDLAGYFRVPLDNRSLNYDAYFSKGNEQISELYDYHSHNTRQLNEDEMIEMLVNLHEIQDDIAETDFARIRKWKKVA
jgi:UDP-glucose 4-epimerase